MARARLPLTPERADAVASYFRGALIKEGAGALLNVGAHIETVRRELADALTGTTAQRTSQVDKWLEEWVTPAGRKRCFIALRQTEYRNANKRMPREPVPQDAWEKLSALAHAANVSPQAALSGLVDYALAEPARQRGLEKFLHLRSLVPKGPRRRR